MKLWTDFELANQVVNLSLAIKQLQILTTPFAVNLNLLGLHDSARNCVRTV